jgi:hypothetical protein
MKHGEIFGAFVIGALLGLTLPGRAAEEPAGTPAENWEMKIFTKEGHRSMILRGSEVRVATANRYDVVDLNITIFAPGPAARVDNMLLSPAATFLLRDNLARGDKSVRFIREDMEVTGEKWTYIHAERKVTIQQNTRVIFNSALPDLIR